MKPGGIIEFLEAGIYAGNKLPIFPVNIKQRQLPIQQFWEWEEKTSKMNPFPPKFVNLHKNSQEQER